MVGHLVSLKWRYVIASLKRSVWALIGIILGVLYLVGILIGLGFLYSFLAFESPEGAASLALLIGTLLSWWVYWHTWYRNHNYGADRCPWLPY